MTDPPSRTGILCRRLGSTLLLWGLLVSVLFLPSPALYRPLALPLFWGIGILGFLEFTRLYRRKAMGIRPALITGVLLLTWEILDLPGGSEATLFFPAFLLLWLLLLKLHTSGRIPLTSLAVTLVGWFYVFWLLLFVIRIHAMNDNAWLLIHFILVTKLSDTGAYVTGSLFGRHRMSPRISAGKTWEGLAGAILFSITASAILVYASGDRLEDLRGLHCLVLGLLMGGLAVVGDLIESLFKRENSTKDTGRLVPGIGGCLDLVDSLLFNAPFYYIYCRIILSIPSPTLP